MKICYISAIRLPGERAHSIQIIKTISALIEKSHEVTLIVPKRKTQTENMTNIKYIRKFYGVKKIPKIIFAPAIDLIRSASRFHISFILLAISFVFYALIYLLAYFKGSQNTKLLYFRDRITALCFIILKPIHRLPIIYEAHDPVGGKTKDGFGKMFWLIIRKANGVLVTSNNLKKLSLIKGIKRERINVVPNAVDLRTYDKIKTPKEKIKFDLGFPEEKTIILYTGSLHKSKNVSCLIDMMKELNNSNILLYIIGSGFPKDIQRIKDYAKNRKVDGVIFKGAVAPSKIPYFLKAADIGIHTISKDSINAIKYGSPLKIFEYMAAGLPIIAANVPSIREILENNKNALLVEIENPIAYAKAVKHLDQNKKFAQKLGETAYTTVKGKYTYSIRAEKILSLIKNIC